jgi:hypothetical protein
MVFVVKHMNPDQPFGPVPFTVNFNITAPSTPRSDIKWSLQDVSQNVVHQGLVLRPNCIHENAGVNKNLYKK